MMFITYFYYQLILKYAGHCIVFLSASQYFRQPHGITPRRHCVGISPTLRQLFHWPADISAAATPPLYALALILSIMAVADAD
jgi:hypothetical protein